MPARENLAIVADACVKANHYSQAGGGAGPGTAIEGGVTGLYFERADASVQELHSADKLHLEDLVAQASADAEASTSAPAAAAPGAAAPAAVDGSRCNLMCGRKDSTHKGPCDKHGIVGCSCIHGIPVRGAFVDMFTPENFSYYIVLFCWLLRMRSITHIFVDFACQLKVSWASFLKCLEAAASIPQRAFASLSSEAKAAARKVQLVVNWMHAKGHNILCQLWNSGLYLVGSGRRGGGEGMEIVWADMKVSSSARLALAFGFILSYALDDCLPNCLAVL